MSPSQRADEAGGSPTLGTQARAASSPDKAGTHQHRQMVWVRQARPEGVTRLNQFSKASQEDSTSSNLMDPGWVAVRTRLKAGNSSTVSVAEREATLKVCGVDVAMRQGHSWAPNRSSGSK